MATALRSQRPTPRDSHRDRLTNRQAALRRKTHLQPVHSATLERSSQSFKPPLSTVSPTSTQSAVRKLPTARPFPNWLRLLIQAQRGSLIVTFTLVVATLVMYGGTVYMQQLWSKEYRKLKTMQRSERQMLAASEVLKNQIIQQAESPNSGLVNKSSQHTLVLESSPLRTVKPVAVPILIKAEASANMPPLGY
ncbi:hypothetical protein JOY44_07170 [Phormidium sp. CLA17]|uniref:hypothetical protein n=1 Tax=Leptolyngbya sp. Cla-17 TaxID=2803751 RepID=UPI0014914403|nr:hypothetical protein [Leptolyngbya sp. Cla-17]MBM0741400.1 hypothetical protein [Leptolyngbya sp. Cla-17]